MVFKSLPYNHQSASLGSESSVAPAEVHGGLFEDVGILQVGRHSCPWKKWRESVPSHRGRSTHFKWLLSRLHQLLAAAQASKLNEYVICIVPPWARYPGIYLHKPKIEMRQWNKFPRPFTDEGASFLSHDCHELQQLIFIPQALPAITMKVILLWWPWQHFSWPPKRRRTKKGKNAFPISSLLLFYLLL